MNNFLQQINSYIKEAFNAGKYLYNGLSVTFDHLRRRPVTVQYPYEKLIPSERYRGRTVSYTHLTLPTTEAV